MACSIIVIRGQRKVTDEQAIEFARLAGLNFIKLQHRRGAGVTEFGSRGFQSAEVFITSDTGGGKRYSYELSKDADGKDCMGQRQLLFIPDNLTGMLMADLIDTPYNRERLIRAYYNNAQWRIVDPLLDNAIRELADRYQESLPKKMSKDDALVHVKTERDELAEENARLKQLLEQRQQVDDVIKDAITPAAEGEGSHIGLTQADTKRLRDKAKTAVYEECAVQIQQLKDTKGRQWASCKDYKENILPVIDARYNKLLEEEYAEHAGAGVNN